MESNRGSYTTLNRGLGEGFFKRMTSEPRHEVDGSISHNWEAGVLARTRHMPMSLHGNRLGGVLEPREGLFLEVNGKGERR